MAFKCQEDSYLTEYTSTVVKCEPTEVPIVEYGKVSKFEGYEVKLENTIFFPAGGGQESQEGTSNETEPQPSMSAETLRLRGERLAGPVIVMASTSREPSCSNSTKRKLSVSMGDADNPTVKEMQTIPQKKRSKAHLAVSDKETVTNVHMGEIPVRVQVNPHRKRIKSHSIVSKNQMVTNVPIGVSPVSKNQTSSRNRSESHLTDWEIEIEPYASTVDKPDSENQSSSQVKWGKTHLADSEDESVPPMSMGDTTASENHVKPRKRCHFSLEEKQRMFTVYQSIYEKLERDEPYQKPSKTTCVEKTANMFGIHCSSVYKVLKDMKRNLGLQPPKRSGPKSKRKDKQDEEKAQIEENKHIIEFKQITENKRIIEKKHITKNKQKFKRKFKQKYKQPQIQKPHDMGHLNDVEVLQVLRKGDQASHFTKVPMAEGTVVKQTIDWDRRFDHMQQHSGQHLLSAILEQRHNLKTTSWWLGAEESYVELDATTISSVTVKQAEIDCNELIRQALPVKVKICRIDDPELNEAHTRGLPKDCMETIRIIAIGDFDENMCCGTHVSNLSQLQMIKLTGCEPGKKGKTNLKFLVGNRVASVMQLMIERERALTALLKNEPTKHEELVSKLQKNLKITNKNLQNVLTELAQYEVAKIKSTQPKPKFIVLFKKESTPEFNRVICKGLEGEDMFVFLASEEPDRPKEGQILIQGPEVHCNALGSQIIEILKGKGAFKNGKFQGKAGDMGGMNKCKKIVEDYFNNLNS